MMPGSRESKPGFEIIAKIVETIPELSTDWLIKEEGDMTKGGITFSGNRIKGNSNAQGFGNTVGRVPDEECRRQLEEMTRDRDKWKDKYIELLEKRQG